MPVNFLVSRLKYRLFIVVPGLLVAAAAAAQDQPVKFDSLAQRAVPCMTCHGKEGRSTSDGYYPRIAGKPAGYLFNQLANFRDGRRQQYPLMIYMVQHLSDPYLQEIATYFSEQHPPYPPRPAHQVSKETLERGRTLVMHGDATKNIPSCVACHGEKLTGVEPSIPGLLGLPRDYINSQFGAWREGARRAAPPDCMAEITKRLTPEDIAAVSTWLSIQPVAGDAMPAPSISAKLPIRCGSFVQAEDK